MNERIRSERGQSTAEYALVMIAAATIALALIIWASTTDVLPEFFSAIIRRVTAMAGG